MGITDYFNGMWNTSSPLKFEKEFSLLDIYITDDFKRNNMLHNEELKRIYNANKSTIRFFLLELENHYDKETIKHLIDSTILRMPESVLKSFMTAYLNSSETAKSNTEVLSFYNKTQALGEEAVKYVEEHGIITSRKYSELPTQIVDDKYKQIRTGKERFRNEFLDAIYSSLSATEKEFVLHLIENKSFDILDQLFGSSNYSLESILHILSAHKIDDRIINNEMLNTIGLRPLYMLILLIMDAEYPETVLNNIRIIIDNKRFDLLDTLINTGLVRELSALNEKQITLLNESEIVAMLTESQMVLRKEAA